MRENAHTATDAAASHGAARAPWRRTRSASHSMRHAPSRSKA